MNDTGTLLVGFAAIPLIVAAVQLLKTTLPNMTDRFIPALTVAIAVVYNCAVTLATQTFEPTAPLTGFVVGLAACGLYSSVKPYTNPAPTPPAPPITPIP